jgi:hypothetical protein
MVVGPMKEERERLPEMGETGEKETFLKENRFK